MRGLVLRGAIFLAISAVAALLLHYHVVRSWQAVYRNFPWNGYGNAMQEGLIEPFFSNSSRSLRDGLAFFFVLTTLLCLFRFGRGLVPPLALWFGATITLTLIETTLRQHRESNLAGLTPFFLGAFLLFPIALGAGLGNGGVWLLSRLKKKNL